MMMKNFWKKFDKIEFSKKLTMFIGLLLTIVLFVTIVMAICSCDITNMVILDGAIITLFTTSVAFYLNKSKAENKLKITKDLVKELGDKYDIQSALQAVEIVTSE